MRKLLMSGAALTLIATGAWANDSVMQTIQDAKQWGIQTGDYANTRYSELDQINKDNVKDLKVAWTFSTGVLRGHEGSPLVVGDIMYVHSPFPNNVFALDLNDNGKILWQYKPQQDPNVIAVMCCDTINRGVAYADGMIFLSQADASVVALDAKTGEVKWNVKVGDPAIGETLTSTVMPVKDKLMVGISGGEYGVRGRMTALNIKDGSEAWKAYSTGPDAEMLVDPEKTMALGKPIGADSSIKTWEGDQWKTGGGTTWGWYAYDPDLNLVYYGTGNPSTWNPSQRPGDNKWSMTIMARDVDTGMAKWLYQMTPHDEWDYDGVNEMILTDQQMDGTDRKLLTHFDRNGFGYTLDRDTGELMVAKKFDPAVNWASEVVMDPASDQYGRPQVVAQYSTGANGEDTNTTGVCPAALGSKDQQPAAYSPDTQLFYVPTNHVCMDYEPFRVSYTAGQPYVGATLSMYPAPNSHGGMGNFIAWDNLKGEVKWTIPETFSVWSGPLATKGGVVFYGTLEGYLKAIDANDGRELYRFKTPSGIIGNVMSYEHDGKQYVAVLSGVGGWAGIGLAAGLTNPNEGLGAVGGYAALSQYTELGGQLTVFDLAGDAPAAGEPAQAGMATAQNAPAAMPTAAPSTMPTTAPAAATGTDAAMPPVMPPATAPAAGTAPAPDANAEAGAATAEPGAAAGTAKEVGTVSPGETAPEAAPAPGAAAPATPTPDAAAPASGTMPMPDAAAPASGTTPTPDAAAPASGTMPMPDAAAPASGTMPMPAPGAAAPAPAAPAPATN